MKPQTPLERTACTAPFSMLKPGRVQGSMIQETYTPGLSLLAYFAAHAPVARQWSFELEEPEPIPAAIEHDPEKYRALAELAKETGERAERVVNQSFIDAAILRNELRKRAAWPWVWARAVLAEIPPVDDPPAPAEHNSRRAL